MQQNSPTSSFLNAVQSLAETEGLNEENRQVLRELLSEVGSTITVDPRQQTEANAKLLFCMTFLLFARVESQYGDGSHEKLSFEPTFQNHPHSQVCPLVNDHDTFGVTVGRHATTWEGVFYEVAHEMVHFLNPVASAHEKELATLEEGVAVKFAEAMYRELISAYTGRPPKISPVTTPDNRYNPAFRAASKIPDAILLEIRCRFGSFSAINDSAAFASLTSKYLEQDEIELLMAPFSYPAPGAFA